MAIVDIGANCGFDKVERLAGNVGYVTFNMFANPAECSQTAISAMCRCSC